MDARLLQADSGGDGGGAVNVWVLTLHFYSDYDGTPYEGAEVVGVYSTQQAAINAAPQGNAQWVLADGRDDVITWIKDHHDRYEVERHEVRGD